MLGKTKNFFLSLNKKKTILFVFFFGFFSLYPLICSAQWLENLKRGVGTYILYLILRGAVTVAVFFTKLAGSLLNWVLSPDFISLSYTNPANNPIIETGLNVTRGFVNMLLVLILVQIAVAVILRLKDYEAKKLLPTFIVIALLVNFTAVICGVIVDASNIVMNFFIQDLNADAFGRTMATRVAEISSGFNDSTTTKDSWQYVTQLAVMVPFLWILSFILFTFTFIFIFRYLAIWLLVILSPLAFVCYILPVTRKYFTQWWEQFINWSIIGITCGFFLYLGLLLVMYVPTEISRPDTEGSPVFNSILPFFVSLAFLILGLIFGLKSSAMGASTIIGVAKTRGRGAIRGAGRVARWAGSATARKIGRGIRPEVEGKARRVAAKAYSTMIKVGDWSPTKKGGFKPFAFSKWAAPQKLKEFGNLRTTIDKGMADAKGQSGVVIGDEIANEKIKEAEATGWYSQLLQQNDSQDLFNAFRRKVGKGAGGKKWKKMSDQEIINDAGFHRIMTPILVHANNSGKLGSTLRRDPRLSEVAYEKDIGSYGKSKPNMNSPQDAVNKAVTEARDHLKDWEPESLKSKKVTGGVMAHLERDRQLQVNRQIKKGRETQLETMDEMFSDFARENKNSLFGDSNISEEKIAKLLSPKGTDPETGKSIESETHKKVWREFDKHIQKTFGGRQYFVSVEEQRMQSSGWRKMNFVPKRPSGLGSTPTPGSATMGGPPPPKGTRATSEKPPKGTRATGKTTPKGTRGTGGKPPKGTRI